MKLPDQVTPSARYPYETIGPAKGDVPYSQSALIVGHAVKGGEKGLVKKSPTCWA